MVLFNVSVEYNGTINIYMGLLVYPLALVTREVTWLQRSNLDLERLAVHAEDLPTMQHCNGIVAVGDAVEREKAVRSRCLDRAWWGSYIMICMDFH